MKSFQSKTATSRQPSPKSAGKFFSKKPEKSRFFSKKTSVYEPFFNQNLIQRSPNEAEQEAATVATRENKKSFTFNDDLKRKFASVIFAEAAPGQEEKIAWIYLNRIVDAGGESGLNGSAAFTGKSDNFKIAMTQLGDEQYANHPPKDQWLKDTKSPTIGKYAEGAYCQKFVAPRVGRSKERVTQVIEAKVNPYEGWMGQGNLNDFNNISNNDVYWKKARAYYWLQVNKQVTENLVEVLEAGANTQFIFDGNKISQYFSKNPDKLPKDVPLYEIKKK